MTHHSGEPAPHRSASESPASESPASESPASEPTAQVSLRGPGELADALPYLVGFHPDDSIVLAAVDGDHGRFQGRIRLGIPAQTAEWASVASQLALSLEEGSLSGGSRPDGAVVFLCQDPAGDESGRAVMERLRPLAQALRTACGAREIPVFEALCVADGRYWSYCCSDQTCCPPEGTALPEPGTSPMAAAAVYAGIRVRGSLREMEARLTPLDDSLAQSRTEALDAASAALIPRMVAAGERTAVRAETIVLARRLLARFRAASADARGGPVAEDAHDDALLSPQEAATVIVGLQDRGTRDQAAEWMEGRDGPVAVRLWRALARRCAGPYVEHAAAPLALAGWVSWSTGDQTSARVAFARALEVDPDYLFAQLLHRACNEGLDPEPLRRCMREERAARRRQRRKSPRVASRRTSR